MKKTILKTLAIFGLCFFCCRAWNNPPNNGTWTITGSTFNTDSICAPPCDSALPCVITAQTPFDSSNISNFSQLSIIFGSPPNSNQTYSLVSDSIMANSNLDSSQAYIQIIKGLLPDTVYQSIGSGSLSVSVSGTGQISVSPNSSINLQQMIPPYDTVQLTFNIGIIP